MSDTAHAHAPGTASRGPAALVAVFGLLLILLLGLVVLANSGVRELAGANRWSIHTYQVITEAEGLSAAQAELETSFRGFALSGDTRFLDAWELGLGEWERHESALLRLTADNPPQQQRARRLAALADSFRALQVPATRIARSDPAAVATARAFAGEAGAFAARRRIGDAIRATLAEL